MRIYFFRLLRLWRRGAQALSPRVHIHCPSYWLLNIVWNPPRLIARVCNLNILVSTLGLYLFSTSSSAFPHTRSRGGVGVSLATTTATQRDTPISSTDRFSVKSTYLASDLERDSKVEQYPTSDSPDSKAEVGLELGLESPLPQTE